MNSLKWREKTKNGSGVRRRPNVVFREQKKDKREMKQRGEFSSSSFRVRHVHGLSVIILEGEEKKKCRGRVEKGR